MNLYLLLRCTRRLLSTWPNRSRPLCKPDSSRPICWRLGRLDGCSSCSQYTPSPLLSEYMMKCNKLLFKHASNFDYLRCYMFGNTFISLFLFKWKKSGKNEKKITKLETSLLEKDLTFDLTCTILCIYSKLHNFSKNFNIKLFISNNRA